MRPNWSLMDTDFLGHYLFDSFKESDKDKSPVCKYFLHPPFTLIKACTADMACAACFHSLSLHCFSFSSASVHLHRPTETVMHCAWKWKNHLSHAICNHLSPWNHDITSCECPGKRMWRDRFDDRLVWLHFYCSVSSVPRRYNAEHICSVHRSL